MKRLLFLAAALVGIATYNKWKDAEVEKSTWSRSTDSVD
ncbi:DLW-39 family protein [Zafaria sp. Z1313]|nr:DLW-39 family protein [Zafaria sp. J156]MEE1621489.1 DLW-39 family protein [Zafaria sp. J156]